MNERPRKPTLSLSTRLLLAITVASFVTLALAVGYIDQAIERGLVQKQNAVLQDHLIVLRQAIEADPENLHAAEVVIQNTLGGDKNAKSFGCLTDATGRHLIETKGFTEFSPPLTDFPAPIPAGQQETQVTLTRPANDYPIYLVAALMLRTGSGETLNYYFAADGLPDEHFMESIRYELALVLLLETLLSAGLAWFISRHGLGYLERITDEIERTTANALQQPDATSGGISDANRRPREVARLFEAFTALRSRLSHSFNQLRQFSDDAAHEIRGPLNNMMGLTSLTLQRDRTPEEYQATLISTLEECDRMKKLADGLLFISRADHRRSALSLTSFDVCEAITEIVDYHSDMAHDRGVTISATASGMLTADRSLFRQSLTNVLSNALRHTPARGQVTVHFEGSTLSVSDTGEGIAPEHLPHVFDRFYRVDAARTHQPDAPAQTGLGLAIVRAIVELHGGTVTAESAVGKGTTVTLVWRQEPVL
ncbi:MAG: hypothetical protein B7Z47_01435 [Chthoniobacter sp. 12-60-6]|nr:MAG: hypothetical protein B7Z47_01435 [Chthoniobacter sp. 12-60-6]